jgi:hypothetical protein
MQYAGLAIYADAVDRLQGSDAARKRAEGRLIF